MRLRMFSNAIDKLAEEQSTVDHLGEVAEKIATRIRPPSGMTVFTRSGVSRRGAFAQAGMRGVGAVPAEWGSRNNAPGGYVRRAAKRGR